MRPKLIAMSSPFLILVGEMKGGRGGGRIQMSLGGLSLVKMLLTFGNRPTCTKDD